MELSTVKQLQDKIKTAIEAAEGMKSGANAEQIATLLELLNEAAKTTYSVKDEHDGTWWENGKDVIFAMPLIALIERNPYDEYGDVRNDDGATYDLQILGSKEFQKGALDGELVEVDVYQGYDTFEDALSALANMTL